MVLSRMQALSARHDPVRTGRGNRGNVDSPPACEAHRFLPDCVRCPSEPRSSALRLCEKLSWPCTAALLLLKKSTEMSMTAGITCSSASKQAAVQTAIFLKMIHRAATMHVQICKMLRSQSEGRLLTVVIECKIYLTCNQL